MLALPRQMFQMCVPTGSGGVRAQLNGGHPQPPQVGREVSLPCMCTAQGPNKEW